ncbi:hypothetical protein llap_1755 [Limosa lapponica baueri]|uniref:Uncharacterized protein n=1 Tax=Limosa lapponica baueri TaxID=1758121 RepID=A0A2I0UPJ9_LIMLA|nr:hypothetical protein llap_1755 [Limosa lapponica baueri]
MWLRHRNSRNSFAVSEYQGQEKPKDFQDPVKVAENSRVQRAVLRPNLTGLMSQMATVNRGSKEPYRENKIPLHPEEGLQKTSVKGKGTVKGLHYGLKKQEVRSEILYQLLKEQNKLLNILVLLQFDLIFNEL